MVADLSIATIYVTLIYPFRTVCEGSPCLNVVIDKLAATAAAVNDARQQPLTRTAQVFRSVVGKYRRTLLHQLVAILEDVVIDEPKVFKWL